MQNPINQDGEVLTYYSEKLSYLPENERRIIVIAHGGIFLNEVRHLAVDVFLTEELVDLNNPPPTPLRVAVPFSDFRMFGIGSIFANQRMLARGSRDQVRILHNFRSRSFVDGRLVEIPRLEELRLMISRTYHMPVKERVEIDLGGPFWRAIHGGRPIYLPMMELVRFYFSSFEKLTTAFLLAFVFPGHGFPLPYVEEETGFDGTTFVITPHKNFADHATCIQMAMILASPDLLNLFMELAGTIEKQAHKGSKSAPNLSMVEGAREIKAVCWDVTIGENFKRKGERARFVTQIESDSRECPFENLVIRDPRPHAIKPKDKEDLTLFEKIARGFRRKKQEADEEGVDERSPPVTVVLPAKLTDAFPSLQKPKVTKVFLNEVPLEQEAAGSQKKRAPKKYFKDVDGAKPVARRRRSGRARTGLDRNIGRHSSQIRLKLFLLVQERQFTLLKNADCDFDERVRTTITALERCVSGQVRGKKQDVITFKDAQSIELDISLDGGAVRTRQVLFSQFSAFGFNGMVVEIQRRKETSISLCVLLRSDGGPMGPQELVKVLKHYSRRVKLRGEKVLKPEDAHFGVWPRSSEFTDVISKTIVHKAPVDDPLYLADAIYAAAMQCLTDAIAD